jgi:hypothetical protein
MISHGLYCGLQNSVIRTNVFCTRRFDAILRNEAEDQLLVIHCLMSGHVFGYFDDIHVVYSVHHENSSAAGSRDDVPHTLSVLKKLAEGYETLLRYDSWRRAERRAIQKRLQQEYFWKLGYSTLWMSGRQHEAMAMFRRGLKYWPWNIMCWKTYLLAAAKQAWCQPGMRQVL